MFLVSNITLALIAAILFFIIFTFVNVLSITKHGLTSVLMTVNFLYLFLVMPFRGTKNIYKTRKKILKKLSKDRRFSNEEKEEIAKIVSSRVRLFILLYRAGAFSYGDLMINFAKWYLNKPFTIGVEFKQTKKQKYAYENQYISYLEHDLKEAIAYCN